MNIMHFRRFSIVIALIIHGLIASQTMLTPGDVAIVGVNTDNPDTFSFVTLTDITIGTKLFFTDSGIQTDGSFRGNEGAILYTAPSNLSAGTIVNFSGISDDFTNASDGHVGTNGFNLSTSGDQIIAFTGSTENPTFIFALQTNSSMFQTNSNDSNQSDLPPGLEIGRTAVAVGAGQGAESEFDNATYNLSVNSGTKDELLTAIATNTNWDGTNNRIDDLPANGTISVVSHGVFLNELQMNTTGTDWEFFEIQGMAGEDLSNLTLITIDGDTSSLGTVNAVVDLTGQSIPADGIWVASSPAANGAYQITGNLTIANNTFENGTTTFLLVTGFTGTNGDDLDINDNGILDVMPWTEIIDGVALTDASATDFTYAGVTAIGPDGTFLPSGIFRSTDAPTSEFNTTTFLSFDTPDGTPGRSNARMEDVFITGNGIRIDTNTNIPNTADGTDFQNVEINTNSLSTFSIENATTEAIHLTAIEIVCTNANDFSLNTPALTLPKVIAAGSRQDFMVNFKAVTAGQKNAIVKITTNTGDFTFDITANAISPAEVTLISAIQGAEAASPFTEQTVVIEGIVVGDFQDGAGKGINGDLNGFFVQEEDVDADANGMTSEGIFIFDGSNSTVDVTVGDFVRITGTVSEFFGATQISSTSVRILSSGHTLPTAAQINLPLLTTTNSNGEAILNLEHVEGMLVHFSQTLTVTELFQLDRFGELLLTQGHRPVHFTQNNTPSVAGFSAHLQDIASRTILLDDGMNTQNPIPIVYPDGALNSQDAFRMGHTTANLTGVVAYSRASGSSGDENYRIHPTIAPAFTATNLRQTTPSPVGGTLKVAAFNVLNYFTTIDITDARTAIGSDPRGADTVEEFNRQRQKLLQALTAINADIFGIIELENDFLVGSSGNAIEDLVKGLNTLLGANTYTWVDPGTQFVGDDTIAVGIIYKPAIVSISEGSTIAILEDSVIPALNLDVPQLTSPLPAVFNGPRTNRAPLAVTFTQNSNSEKFTVVVNHFKSKGSVGPAPGDEVINDGKGSSNQTRLNASIILDAWLATDPTHSNDSDYLVLGDLNAYASESPITYLEDRNYTDLARHFLGDDSAFSFVFDGQIGTLDYALANSSLTPQITGATEWHINADEPDAIDYNLDFGRSPTIFNGDTPFRSSDHDPILIGLDLNASVLSAPNLVISKNAPLVYPNPFSDLLNLLHLKGETTVLIFDTSGKKVLETFFEDASALTLKTTTLAKGTYLLSIKNSTTTFSRVVVKP